MRDVYEDFVAVGRGARAECNGSAKNAVAQYGRIERYPTGQLADEQTKSRQDGQRKAKESSG